MKNTERAKAQAIPFILKSMKFLNASIPHCTSLQNVLRF